MAQTATIIGTFASDGNSSASRNDYTYKIYDGVTLFKTVGSHTSDSDVTVSGSTVTITNIDVDYDTEYDFTVVSIVNGVEAALATNSEGAVTSPSVEAPTGTPQLTNFRNDNTNKNRVYFDSDNDVTGLTTTGFTVANKTISSITIDGDGLGGYFTLSTDLTYWDNNTIRLESGDGTVEDFTLSYVTNNITEPSTSTVRYVTTSATGSNNGTTEALAWTLEQAFDNASSGMTVWIKAGNYGNINESFGTSGTATSPIKFKGYKTAIGDITTNYFDYGVTWSTSEMPTFSGSDSTNGIGLWVNSAEYIFFENIQMSGYRIGMRGGFTSPGSHIVIKNCNFKDMGNNAGGNGSDSEALSFQSEGTFNAHTTFVGWSGFKLINNRFVNAALSMFTVLGDGNGLYDSNKTYSDRTGSEEQADYHMIVNGDNNIIRNQYSENINTTSTNLSTHGIGIRGENRFQNNYNLIELSEAVNFNENFYIRNYGCNYNVIKDNISRNNGFSWSTAWATPGGIDLDGGVNYNTIERNIIHGVRVAFLFKDSNEDGHGTALIADNTIIRNNVIYNVQYLFFGDNNTSNSTLTNTKFYNNSVDDVDYLFNNASAGTDVSNFLVKNCQMTNIANQNDTPSGFTFDYSNFYGSYSTLSGTGNIAVNPYYTSSSNLRLTASTATTVTEGGTILSEVVYDFDNKYRGTTPSIGAFQYEVGDTEVPTNLYTNNDAASKTSESNTVGTWATSGATTTSVAETGGGSSYVIEVTNTSAATGNHAEYNWTTDGSSTYEIKFWARVTTGGSRDTMRIQGFTSDFYSNITTTWTSFTITAVSNDTTGGLTVFGDLNAATDGAKVQIDEIIITKL